MEHINQTANRALSHSTGKAITTGETLTTRDAVIIDRFYAQLADIYGHKFQSVFNTDDDIDRNKRVWGSKIVERTPEQLGKILSTIKSTGIPEWPDMGKILNTNTSASPTGMHAAAYKVYHPEPKPSASKVEAAEKKARGLERLAQLRQCLGMEPVSKRSQEAIQELEALFDRVGAQCDG